jgi:hypothetical protein
MNKFARDIQLTLCIKLVLLLGLWFFCFKGAVKNTTSTQQWLFGMPALSAVKMPVVSDTQPIISRTSSSSPSSIVSSH